MIYSLPLLPMLGTAGVVMVLVLASYLFRSLTPLQRAWHHSAALATMFSVPLVVIPKFLLKLLLAQGAHLWLAGTGGLILQLGLLYLASLLVARPVLTFRSPTHPLIDGRIYQSHLSTLGRYIQQRFQGQ